MRWHMIYRRWRQGAPFIKGVLLVTAGFCLVSLAAAGLPRLNFPSAVPALADGGRDFPGQGLFRKILESYEMDFTRVFEQGLPFFCRRQLYEADDTTGSSFLLPWLKNPRKLGMDLRPLSLVQSELGWFELAVRGGSRNQDQSLPDESYLVSPEPKSAPVENPKREVLQPTIRPEGPAKVAIYHTHTSEDYVPSCGNSHTYGQEAGIVAVGRELASKLEQKHRIRCLHDTSVHDTPVYREAYLRSGNTVEKLIKENPELEIILDVHSDAFTKDVTKSRTMTTTTINDQQVARIYIVVGTDRLGLTHPNWQQNHAFALELQQQLGALYPGLSRGIKIDTARFNQHLHSRLVLIEIGGDQNTLEEAKLGAGYLADVLVAWLRNQTEN